MRDGYHVHCQSACEICSGDLSPRRPVYQAKLRPEGCVTVITCTARAHVKSVQATCRRDDRSTKLSYAPMPSSPWHAGEVAACEKMHSFKKSFIVMQLNSTHPSLNYMI